MQTEFKRLKRRPFLVPLLLPLVLVALIAVMAIWVFDARATSIIIVVPNAETEAQTNSNNPALSDAGQLRAKHLQQFLDKAKPNRGIDVVYVSEGLATQQTAAPVASSMGLAVNVIPNALWPRLQHIITRDHSGEVTLVVATADKIRTYLAQAGVGEVNIDTGDNSSVFVISRSSLSKKAVVRLRYD
jgi:hypothetical protein